MLDVADFTVLYAPVAGICSLHIIIEIALEEGLIIFVLEIFNDFNNNVLPNPVEIFYLILPHLYTKRFKIKPPKHPSDFLKLMDALEVLF